ncbi:fumarylacetoacetate hydrolase family protein [Meridianimarinicoccus sp. RP-17]|uniref:fumarylacetoacetate hydrolase family protein n=1 Tax=Meridianimarinicoccus zhengii TaxID=2056810 RepID=UPI000DABCF89|nr:fumarylacetoacetate hydrolase family protein [Phycocomes zhengii]
MKLIRFGERGAERPGVIDATGTIRDLAGVVPDIAGPVLSDTGLAALREIDTDSLPAVRDGVRVGPCVGGVGKIIGIGLNYSDHAAEAGMPEPAEPILFMKAASSLCGPNDPTPLPPGSEKLDWEVELAIVIGTTARNVTEADALAHVAGYAVCNDVSERGWQLGGTGQWVKGKSFDNFAPLGPWLVTRDDVPDPQDLSLWLDVNGVRAQTGSTAKMIFGAAHLVSYVSRFMTLHPGDVITTGTPPGVGMGMKPPRYLKVGDVVDLGIDGLGAQRQEIVADRVV